MLRRRTEYGEVFSAHGVRVIPESRSISHMGQLFGAVWNRPTAVIVQDAGGAYRMPILDLTRVVQIGLLLLSAVLLVVAGIMHLQNRRQ
jgi:hypothetical protein